MMSEKYKKRKATVASSACVACGCCIKACRLGAIAVFHGMYATVDTVRCVGCGACQKACPAAVITIEEVDA